MVVKSLLAGTVLAGLAGGVVYFGMGGELAETDALSRSNSTAIEMTAPQGETELAGADSKSSARKAVAAKPEAKAAPETKPDRSADPESSKDKLKSLFGRKPKVTAERGDVEAEADIEAVEVEAVEETQTKDQTKPKKRWLDEYLKSDKADKPDDIEVEVEEAKTEDVEVEEDQADIAADLKEDAEKSKTVTRTTIEEIEEIVTEDDTGETTRTVTRTMKPGAKGAYKVVVKETDKSVMATISPAHNGAVFDLLMREADKLDIPDMRDQAYLNIVDFALTKGDRVVADEALAELSREELRDTARGRVAVSLAQAGEGEAAFDVLQDLEIDELQGPIRLQIIEAITAAGQRAP